MLLFQLSVKNDGICLCSGSDSDSVLISSFQYSGAVMVNTSLLLCNDYAMAPALEKGPGPYVMSAFIV